MYIHFRTKRGKLGSRGIRKLNIVEGNGYFGKKKNSMKNLELPLPQGNSEEKFMNILHKNMQPVYDSARRQGYEIWNGG